MTKKRNLAQEIIAGLRELKAGAGKQTTVEITRREIDPREKGLFLNYTEIKTICSNLD